MAMGSSRLARHIAELDVYGFTVLEDVLPGDTLAQLREAVYSLHDKCQTLEPGKKRLLRSDDGAGRIEGSEPLCNLVTKAPEFFVLIDYPEVLEVVESFLGKKIILGSLNARVLEPGAEAQMFHSDIPGSLRNITSTLMINVAWMIDEFTVENGATELVPGTHRHPSSSLVPGFRPENAIKAIASAGSALIFNGQCWHRSGDNRSSESRAAIFAHYRVGYWMRFQWDPHHRFPNEWWDRLSARQKELLRMEDGVGGFNSADVYDL